MKTTELIALLSQDNQNRLAPLKTGFANALLLSMVIFALFIFLVLGLRADLATAIYTQNFILKLLFTTSLTLIFGILAYKSAFPQRQIKLQWALLPLLVLALLALFYESQTNSMILKSTWFECITLIPLISLFAFAPFFLVFKNGASANPRLSGFALGGFLGALGASFYTLHCIEDSLLFILIFYSSAIVVSALFGMVAGQKWLKW